ncbi:MAG: hypothetical protein Tsb0034_00690 [Ekhidna sp.]
MNNVKALFTFLLMGQTLLLMGQADSTSTGGQIVTGEVVIEKNKEILLPKADKYYKKAELKTFNSQPTNPEFTIPEPALEWPPYKTEVPFTTVESVYPLADYQNYARLGYGNFNSLLAEVGLFHRFDEWQTGAKVFFEHFGKGPINDENSASTNFNLNLFGRRKWEAVSLKPYLKYSLDRFNFYGNTNRINTGYTDEQVDPAALGALNIGVRLENQSGEVKYHIKPWLQHTSHTIRSGRSINTETVFNGEASVTYRIDKALNTGLNVEAHAGQYKGGFSYNRSLFTLNPWVGYKGNHYKLKGGFIVATSESNNESKTGFYPDLHGELTLAPDWSVYGSFTGGVSWNGLNDVLQQNNFMDDSLALLNTETTSQIEGGVKGSPLKNMILKGGISLTNLKNLPIYVPSASDSSRYSLTYDAGTITRFTIFTDVSFSPTNVSTYGASLNIHNYSTDTLDRPWHLPNYEFAFYTVHNINSKLIASANLIAMGGMKAPANIDFGIAALDPIFDLSLSLKYLFNKRTSAFVDINNLIGNEYERYLGYPIRGLGFKVGAEYRF